MRKQICQKLIELRPPFVESISNSSSRANWLGSFWVYQCRVWYIQKTVGQTTEHEIITGEACFIFKNSNCNTRVFPLCNSPLPSSYLQCVELTYRVGQADLKLRLKYILSKGKILIRLQKGVNPVTCVCIYLGEIPVIAVYLK